MSATGVRLLEWQGARLRFARAAWFLTAALAVGALLASVPGYIRLAGVYTEQEHYAAGLMGSPGFFSPSPQFELWVDVAYNLLSFAAAALSLVLAALIFWRRPREPIAYLTSLTLLAYGIVMAGPLEMLLEQSLAGQSLAYFAQMLLWGFFIFLFFVFPDGRFVPGWTRWFSLLLVPWTLLLAFAQFNATVAANLAPFFILYTLPSLAAPYAQLVRYRRVSDAVQRQQTKWVILGFSAWMLAGTALTGLLIAAARLFVVPATPTPTPASLIFVFAARLLWPLSLTCVPASLAVAILRYRLFDINVLIRRASVYGALTTVIVALYMLIVGGLSVLLQTSNTLAPVVLTAVGAAVLFRPLRARFQRGADRLLYGAAGTALPKALPPDDTQPPPAAEPAPLAMPARPHVARPERQQNPLPVAWGLLWLSLLLIAGGLLFSLRLVAVGQASSLEVSGQFVGAATVMAFAVVGALIARRQPHNRIGWLFGAVGLLGGLMLFSDGYSLVGLRTDWRGFLYGLDVARWLGLWTWIPVTILPVTFILLLFPDGRLPSARWRLVAWSAGIALAAYIVLVAFHPGPGVEPRLEPNPFGIRAVRQLEILYPAIALLLMLGIGGSVAAVIVRFWRSGGIERQQFKWLVYAALFGLVLNLFTFTLGAIWPQHAAALADLETALAGATLLAIVTAAGLAILRYRLYDIDILINRTLVYGSLTIVVVGIYVIAVGYLSQLFQASGSFILSLLATGLIAVFFQPLRERLQRAANRLLYGERDEPYAVLSRLGKRLEATLEPEAVLPALVETIAQALKLPYVAVALQAAGGSEPQVAAAYGLPTPAPTRMPLTYHSEFVGELWVAPRGPGEIFTPAEQSLLADIAHQAGVAAHAVRLTDDLQRSRERLVSALEEERRRLRRDLHDGLGPQLASQTLTLTAARQLLRQNPAQAEALLAEAIQHAQDAVTDIRRVVYDLRPPALDDLGLAGALRAQAAEFETSGVRFAVNVPEALPPLPAAVEVACYRIAQEALTNVVKHAHAQNCALTLAVDAGRAGAVSLDVVDDGRGLPAERRAGVGLSSMRERAAELGGQCLIEPGPAGGTRVRARLPLG